MAHTNDITLTRDSSQVSSDEIRVTWRTVQQSLTRPYPVSTPMVVLVGLVPLYLAIAGRARTGAAYTPAVALDHLLPLVPAWALVYGSLYAFLIVLPVLVIQQDELIRRTVWAYLTVWSLAYLGFLLYPTVAPRPETVTGDGFAAWGLRFLYDADPPYNCFPSLHVAHSFVSALACRKVHRTLGTVAITCALLVALSTLFTRQHYIADVMGGMLLAAAANRAFLSAHGREGASEVERRVAPLLALCLGGVIALGVAGFWMLYFVRVRGLP